jgi:hypothetical protein
MPYIKQDDRGPIDEAIEAAVHNVRLTPGKVDGPANYAVTKLLLGVFEPAGYADMARVLGCLESVKLEFYRRFAAPYEDKKAAENGDVYHE